MVLYNLQQTETDVNKQIEIARERCDDLTGIFTKRKEKKNEQLTTYNEMEKEPEINTKQIEQIKDDYQKEMDAIKKGGVLECDDE